MDEVIDLVARKVREAESFNARDESEWCFTLAELRKLLTALDRIKDQSHDD